MRQVTHKKPKGNRLICLFLVFFFGGYLFFFVSPLLLPGGEGYQLSEIGQTNTSSISGRAITLVRWDYAPEQELMEIEIDITNRAADGVDQYAYTAATDPTADTKLRVMVEEPTYVVLQLSGVTDAMIETVVRMVKSDPQTKSEEICRFFTNCTVVNRVERLEEKTALAYRLDRMKRKVTELQDTITADTKQIEDLKQMNQTLVGTNEALIAMEEYVPTDEGEALREQIAGNKATKKNNLDRIKSLEEALQTNIAEIERLEEQMKKLK